jgi:hypothetical protein
MIRESDLAVGSLGFERCRWLPPLARADGVIYEATFAIGLDVGPKQRRQRPG